MGYGAKLAANAASGIMANYADEEGSPRGPGAVNYIDVATGVYNALGIVVAAISAAARRLSAATKIPAS